MEYVVFINHWFLILATFLCVPFLILFLYVITGLRSKFDPLFKNVKGLNNPLPLFLWSGPIIRGMTYAACIAYPTIFGKKHKYYFKLYQGYDFRKDCNIVQIIVAWIWLTFALLIGLLGMIHVVLSWLLGIPAFPSN